MESKRNNLEPLLRTLPSTLPQFVLNYHSLYFYMFNISETYICSSKPYRFLENVFSKVRAITEGLIINVKRANTFLRCLSELKNTTRSKYCVLCVYYCRKSGFSKSTWKIRLEAHFLHRSVTYKNCCNVEMN